MGGPSFKSSLFMDIIGELVLASSPWSSARNSTMAERDELGNSPSSSWIMGTACGPAMLGKRRRVRSDRGEALKSTVERVFRDATGVTAVICKGCVFTP